MGMPATTTRMTTQRNPLLLQLLLCPTAVQSAWRSKPLRAVYRSWRGSAPSRSLSTECSADVLVRRAAFGSALVLRQYLLLAQRFSVVSVPARNACVQSHGDIH